jgi:hypothetical protein
MKTETKFAIGYWSLFFPVTSVALGIVAAVFSRNPIAGVILFPFALVIPVAMQELGLRLFQKKICFLLGALPFLLVASLPLLYSLSGMSPEDPPLSAKEYGFLILTGLYLFLVFAGPILMIGRWGWKAVLPGTLLVWIAPIAVDFIPGNAHTFFGSWDWVGPVVWVFLGWLPAIVCGCAIVGLRAVVNRAIARFLSRWELPLRTALFQWIMRWRAWWSSLEPAAPQPIPDVLQDELSKLAEARAALLPIKKSRHRFLFFATVLGGAGAGVITFAFLPSAAILASVIGCGIGHVGTRLAFHYSASQCEYASRVRDLDRQVEVILKKIENRDLHDRL